MECYESRDHVLQVLGFESYEQYLLSPLWRRIRKKAMEGNGGTCIACGKRAAAVHHTSYDLPTMTGENLNGLVLVCDTCHHLAEFDSAGNKRNLEGANRFLGLMRRREPRKKKRHNKEPLYGKALVRKLNPVKVKRCKQEGCNRQVGPKHEFCRSCRKLIGQSDGAHERTSGQLNMPPEPSERKAGAVEDRQRQ